MATPQKPPFRLRASEDSSTYRLPRLSTLLSILLDGEFVRSPELPPGIYSNNASFMKVGLALDLLRFHWFQGFFQLCKLS